MMAARNLLCSFASCKFYGGLIQQYSEITDGAMQCAWVIVRFNGSSVDHAVLYLKRPCDDLPVVEH